MPDAHFGAVTQAGHGRETHRDRQIVLQSLRILAVSMLVPGLSRAAFGGDIPAVEPFGEADTRSCDQILVDIVRAGRVAVQVLIEEQREFEAAADGLRPRRGRQQHGRRRDRGELRQV